MTRGSGSPPLEFERLKALLVGPESERLSRLSDKVDGLDTYIGQAPRLEIATAEILAKALRRAEVDRHRELANALSPLVVSAIRSEIKNSRDAMVEALYPITGRLVAAAVAAAFRDLNARSDALTSAEGVKLRVRALLAGKSVSELALAQAGGRVTRILLVERGGGALAAVWQADGQTPDQPELLSGLIAAITEFANSTLGAAGGELRTLDLGASRVILRMSPRMIIAANCDGALRPGREQALDAAFLTLLQQHDSGSGADAAMLAQAAAAAAPPERPEKAKSSGIALYAIGALIAGLLVWWGASRYLDARHDRQLRQAFNAALAADPALAAYPLQLTIDRAAGTVRITGLAPDTAAVDALAARLRDAAFPRPVIATVAQVAPAARVAELESAAAALAARAQAAERQGDALASQTRDDMAGLQKTASQLGAGLAAAQAELTAAQRRAAEAAQGFAADSAQRDAADARLRAELAAIGPQLAGLRGEVEGIGPQLADTRAALEKQAGDVSQKLELGDTRSAEFDRQLAALRSLSDTVRGQLESIEAATQRLRKEIEGVAPQMRDVKSEIARETGDIKSGLGARDARAADIQKQIAALEAASEKLRAQLQGVSSALPEVEARALAQSQETLAAERRRLEAAANAIDANDMRVSGLIGSVGGQSERLGELAARLETAQAQARAESQRVSDLEKSLAAVVARITTPEAQLKILLAKSAVYFARDTALDDQASAFATVSEIAALAKQTGAYLRVVGHTDDKGGITSNLQLALKRASFAAQMLVARGVDERAITATSRGSAEMISEAQGGARYLNRRVTFELATEAEAR